MEFKEIINKKGKGANTLALTRAHNPNLLISYFITALRVISLWIVKSCESFWSPDITDKV